MVSTYNPFRTPAVTPTPTGASNASQAVSSPLHNPSTGDVNQAASSGRHTPEPQATDVGRSASPLDRSVNDLLTEELPPAYTPAPNVYEGEATLELGPRRPFQNPVPVQPQDHPPWVSPQPPNHSPWLSPQPTATSDWAVFPASRHRESANLYTRPAPPPVHPSHQGLRPSSTPLVPASPSQPLSDFARDFYAAGAGTGMNEGVLGGPSAQYQSDTPGASSSSATVAQYAPPPGEPPYRATKSGPTSPTGPGRDQVPDDGRPTEKPVPGHPLLRHGKVLVYPKDYECHKCHNTGYKNYDPSHPCSRCWDKYAKPYTGALTYTPWGADASGPSSAGSARTTLQRPLPQFRAPQASLHQPSASWYGPPPPPPRGDPSLSRSASTSRVGSGYPGASARVIPVFGGGVPVGSYLDPLQARGRPAFPPQTWFGGPQQPVVVDGPPPRGNAVVYAPGDPRLGGRLCWRCGGDGKTSLFIFDEETCRVCNGIGRTYV
ncbi:hypothetical protein C8Q77DRAFT_1062868 [Trametes polyzona]|nr:hypothetical protein C8Q77DRAFT_1062868 [Trametes polyzona]